MTVPDVDPVCIFVSLYTTKMCSSTAAAVAVCGYILASPGL